MSLIPMLLTVAIGVPLLLVVPALILQASCKVAGVQKRRVPGLFKAVFVALFAAFSSVLLTAAWSCTFGLVLGLVFGKTVVTGLSYAVSVLSAAAVYRMFLGVRLPRAFVVSGVSHLLGLVFGGLAWAIFGWLSPFL